MTPSRKSVVIQQAERIPGLYNIDIIEHGGEHETFWDLTSGQVRDLLRQRGIDTAEIYAVPQ